MKVTIARKIGFLLLLFTLVGFGELVTVYWLSNRYSPDRRFDVLLGTCVLNVILFLTGLCLSRSYLVRPIRLIEAGALAVRAGDLTHRVPVVTRDELAALTESFNEMSASIARLMVERDRAETALRDSEASCRLLFDNNPQPMWVYDVETLAFLRVNNAAVCLYEYSEQEFLSMTIDQIQSPEDIPSGSEMASLSFGGGRHTKRDGSTVEVEITSHNLKFGSRPARLVVAHDVTGKKMLAREQMHSQKLETIGRLSGGIAHDVNNLLTIISGYSDLLLQKSTCDNPARAEIARIKKASVRAASLTRQLLAFGRKQVLPPKIVNVNEIIWNSCEMWSRLLGEDIVMTPVLYPDLWPVRVDPVQFEQVLINLYINARDAMPDGGKLTIRTGNIEIDERRYSKEQFSLQGPHITVFISDTGCGMDEATMSEIFEPFFTTKPAGQGTGLGLSTVHAIMKQSQGHISVKSKPGRGTTFELYFPALPGATPEAEAILPVRASLASGSEVILLVENDRMVRDLSGRALKDSGYTVLEASNGVEALRIANEHLGHIDLLLTDVVMPSMNGGELSCALRGLRPQVKVLFMSGYDADVVTGSSLADGLFFLQKPFSMEELTRRVRELLDMACSKA